MMKTNKEHALVLLNDLLQLAETEDERWKLEQTARRKGEKTIGQSFWVHHLRLLKELLEKPEENV